MGVFDALFECKGLALEIVARLLLPALTVRGSPGTCRGEGEWRDEGRWK